MILSPHGEGYCTTCRFILGLDAFGLVENHMRTQEATGRPAPCEGSGSKPPKRTPYSSNLSKFSTRATKAKCPVCMKRVATTRPGRPSHSKVIGAHVSGGNLCKGSMRQPYRNHNVERG